MNIKKGDTIKVITGKESGKTGKVIRIVTKSERILVEGVNMYKKHVRAKRQGEKGEAVQVPRPFSVSNAMLVCPRCGKPTRVGFSVEDKAKKRMCKKCKGIIS